MNVREDNLKGTVAFIAFEPKIRDIDLIKEKIMELLAKYSIPIFIQEHDFPKAV